MRRNGARHLLRVVWLSVSFYIIFHKHLAFSGACGKARLLFPNLQNMVAYYFGIYVAFNIKGTKFSAAALWIPDRVPGLGPRGVSAARAGAQHRDRHSGMGRFRSSKTSILP